MIGKRIVFSAFGEPQDQLEIEDYNVPSPSDGEVLVRIRFCPINPADTNYVQGTYGVRPKSFPSPAGMEGSGEVLEVGAGVEGIAVGDRVVLLGSPGCWQQYRVVLATDLLVVPEGIDLRQAAMLKVNPPTARLMLDRASAAEDGKLVVQNLGNSMVGLSAIQIAGGLGIDLVTFVRSESARETCLEFDQGAKVYIDSDEGLEQAKSDLGNRRASLALNGVGGDSALRMMNLLGEGGTLLTYGAMGRRALKVPNGLLLFKDLRVEGFWLTRWDRQNGDAAMRDVLTDLAADMAEQRLTLPIRVQLPFDQIAEAYKAVLDSAVHPGAGKVMLDFG